MFAGLVFLLAAGKGNVCWFGLSTGKDPCLVTQGPQWKQAFRLYYVVPDYLCILMYDAECCSYCISKWSNKINQSMRLCCLESSPRPCCQGLIVRAWSSGPRRQGLVVRAWSSGPGRQGLVVRASSSACQHPSWHSDLCKGHLTGHGVSDMEKGSMFCTRTWTINNTSTIHQQYINNTLLLMKYKLLVT